MSTTGTNKLATEYASAPELMPRQMPMAMPEQDFDAQMSPRRDCRERHFWVPRVAIAGATLILTLAFAVELYDVLAAVQVTPLQLVFLAFSTIAFGWIAFGSLSATFGFLSLYGGERADTLKLPILSALRRPTSRTALLFPVYHEDPSRIAGTIEAVAGDLIRLGVADRFDTFVLSDTRGADGEREEPAYRALRNRLRGVLEVFYRRRRDNTAKKAGNIKDWVERFGAGYEHFVIFDGDSVMAGETLVQLAVAMEDNPRAGLIQTVPRLAGGETVMQRLQQFASSVYGQAIAAGLAFWHRDQGNYWGHNAIIRSVAFAGAAGLPPLPGRAPFGGHIQSHDFVEAVLLQRAGWGVHMVPTAGGSYEGLPPNLVDLVVRDRRWAQGNLQHLSIVGAKGLTPMGRVHLIMGALSYLISGVWALTLLLGVMLALQAQQMIPSYFTDEKTLFPIWPTIDPGAALRLFAATMLIVLLPKILGLVLEFRRSRVAREDGGGLRAVGGVAVETLFSMLFAPILMFTQTIAVVQILLRRDSGWAAQRRDDGAISFDDALVFHWRHMLSGLALILICWQVSGELVVWMSPVIAGLVLAAPLTWFTSRPAGPLLCALLSTPEERAPPAILDHADQHTFEWSMRLKSMAAGGNCEPGIVRAA